MKSTSECLKSLRIQQKQTSELYKPSFYRINNLTDREKFDELLLIPGITVVDYISDQIKEFIKAKNPGKKFSTEDLESQTKKHIEHTTIDEYGVWVYYPWSNRLVHILDKEEFIEVRTSRNQYKITREERDLLATKKIGVVGLSVGQSVSMTLAMERICGELRLADFDILELTNLNRIRTGVHNLGLAKVYSVAREISEIDPFINVKCFSDGLTESNMNDFFTKDGKLDLLVEESDGFDIKLLCRYKARDLKVPVIMEASDRCMVDVERFDLEPERSILHGIVDHLDIDTLKKLTTNEEKIPYMLDILGLETTTPRLRASMLEMQQTISTWPQLGSAVTMGGGITADVSRRMLLNHFTESGRYYVDIDEIIGNKQPKSSEKTSVKNAQEITAETMKKAAGEISVKITSNIAEEHLDKIVEAACSAPSYANSQPWKWLSLENKLFLFHDKQHSCFNNSDQMNAELAFGAAIENSVLKAQELGYQTTIEISPENVKNSHVAVLAFTKNTSPNSQPDPLGACIFERHTDHKSGKGKPLNRNILSAFEAIAKENNEISLSLVSDESEIKKLSQIAGALERMRLLNPSLHFDYFKTELQLTDKKNRAVNTGVSIKTLELPSAMETAFEVISDPAVANLLNKWEKGSVFENFFQTRVSGSSAVGLLTLSVCSKLNLINAGRTMERIWLTATKNNLGFQPICLPLYFLRLLGGEGEKKILSKKNFYELKVIKDQLSLIFSELNSREAVFLFRVSETDKSLSRSLRKPLNEVYFKS